MPKKRKQHADRIAKALGATELLSTQRLTLYIPHQDKTGKKIKNIRRWIDDAAKLLAVIGGGSTALPAADVVWIRSSAKPTPADLKEADLLREKTTVLYTYLDADRLMEHLGILREFLYRFGKETNQREVVIEFNNRFYKLKNLK